MSSNSKSDQNRPKERKEQFENDDSNRRPKKRGMSMLISLIKRHLGADLGLPLAVPTASEMIFADCRV